MARKREDFADFGMYHVKEGRLPSTLFVPSQNTFLGPRGPPVEPSISTRPTPIFPEFIDKL